MRRMRRHRERDDVLLFAESLEIGRNVALVPVDDQHSMCALYTRSSVFIEMPNPVQTCLIVGPSIRGRFNDPVAWYGAVGVPVREVVDAFHYYERRDAPAVRTHALDHGHPFPIARLDLFSLSAPIGAGHDYRGRDLAHHEAGLVEVV